jgi:glycine cleavage system H lipoate-binding protein
MEQNGTVKIGIDDFLQHVTGPVTSLGLKNPGVKIKKGDQLCIIIQNGKHLTVYSPVSGTIAEKNPWLAKNSHAINNSPYTDGWLYRIEPTNWARETEFLSMADSYRNWLKSEFARLKDFLATILQSDPKYSLVLQDGGALRDHVLADFGPEVWEDFQTKFINTAR